MMTLIIEQKVMEMEHGGQCFQAKSQTYQLLEPMISNGLAQVICSLCVGDYVSGIRYF